MRSDSRTASSRQDSITSRYSSALRARAKATSASPRMLFTGVRRSCAMSAENLEMRSKDSSRRSSIWLKVLARDASSNGYPSGRMRSRRFVELMWRAVVAISSTGRMPCRAIWYPTNGKWRRSPAEWPEPKPIACQQLLFARHRSQSEWCRLSAEGTDRRRRAGHAKGAPVPALHSNGAIRGGFGFDWPNCARSN
jgi:hypothetical protein